MRFIDSVKGWIENPVFVAFNKWFYKQDHKSGISLMAANNRTIWGWIKQYAFETEEILLEILSVHPFPRNKFRGIMSVRGNKITTVQSQELDTIDEAMDWVVGKYFNHKRGQ